MQDQAANVAYLIRVVRIAFIVSGGLFIYVMVRIPSQAEASPAPTLEWTIIIMSLVCIAVGFLAPRFLAGTMRTQGPPQKQFTMTILSLAFFEAAILFGLVLHFLGADVLFVRVAVAAGMISQLVWSPPSLPNPEDEDTLGPRQMP